MSNSNSSGPNSINTMLPAALPLSTKEGNRIITNFVGNLKVYKVLKNPNSELKSWIIEDFNFVSKIKAEEILIKNIEQYPNALIEIDFDVLEFHSSWDWLMPVIEKISRIKYDEWEEEIDGETYIESDTAYPRTFGMINSKTGNPMFRYNRFQLFEANTLIEAAWLATIDFIQNENEPPKGSR